MERTCFLINIKPLFSVVSHLKRKKKRETKTKLTAVRHFVSNVQIPNCSRLPAVLKSYIYIYST